MKPTSRFTKTVDDYVKYRPSYPREVLQVLVDECGLTKESIIADVGSGTGLLSRLFLERGNVVYGVEPNAEMRAAGEHYLQGNDKFISVNGTAEATTLRENSVDFITAGTAFHWFDADKTKVEFQRILKSSGWVLLVWNVRDLESKLIREYEHLIIKYGTDYSNSRAHQFDHTVTAKFFAPFEMKEKSFSNKQVFDWEGFRGRLLSASYSPRPGDPVFDEMMSHLKTIFEGHQKQGKIEFLYSTKLYYGRLR